MSPRFEMFLKASSDGKSLGDCPFCHYANMVLEAKKVPKDHYTVTLINLSDKPKTFLALNPSGTVPVFRDLQSKEVIADSQLIVYELEQRYPLPKLQAGFECPATRVSSGLFGKLATLLKNKDKDAVPGLRKDLEEELAKVNEFLKTNPGCRPFLLGDQLQAPDCSLLPKLYHVKVAGWHFHNFEIPQRFHKLHQYIEAGQACAEFRHTKYNEEEIIKGWLRHGVTKFE